MLKRILAGLMVVGAVAFIAGCGKKEESPAAPDAASVTEAAEKTADSAKDTAKKATDAVDDKLKK